MICCPSTYVRAPCLRKARSAEAGWRDPSEAAVDTSGGDILVTGSRIRGAPIASPVIAIEREAILGSGGATLPEALRVLPQNFGGGQNPGIGFNVPEANGGDGGGASINLRGLSSDATLALLNGHRLAYKAAEQNVDISTNPLGAVEQIAILPDGASAFSARMRCRRGHPSARSRRARNQRPCPSARLYGFALGLAEVILGCVNIVIPDYSGSTQQTQNETGFVLLLLIPLDQAGRWPAIVDEIPL